MKIWKRSPSPLPPPAGGQVRQGRLTLSLKGEGIIEAGQRSLARIYLINVGANSSHPVKSPLFPDGSFELLPIPERVPHPGSPMLRYEEVPACALWRREGLTLVPSSYLLRYCHYDPEFVTRTYGDDPDRAPRAAALRQAQRGDLLLFLARLWSWDGGFSGDSGFYLVGMLEVASILRAVHGPPSPEDLGIYGANAHIRRSQADPAYWNGFWVFKGSAASRRFQQALGLTPALASAILRDRNGRPWRWRPERTPLQTIGSYTRTIRCICDTESDAFRQWPGQLREALGQ